MSTPLQRARTKLRVMYRLQQAVQEHRDRAIEVGEEGGPASPAPSGALAQGVQVTRCSQPSGD